MTTSTRFALTILPRTLALCLLIAPVDYAVFSCRVMAADSTSHAIFLTEKLVDLKVLNFHIFDARSRCGGPAMANTLLQAAMRKEVLDRKRREEKKARRGQQPLDDGVSEGDVGKGDGPSTSALTQGPPVKASRWENEDIGGVGAEGLDETLAMAQPEPSPRRQSSVMARTAHAEIAAFRKRYGGKEHGKGEDVGDLSREGATADDVREDLDVSPALEARHEEAPKLGDLDELEDIGDLGDLGDLNDQIGSGGSDGLGVNRSRGGGQGRETSPRAELAPEPMPGPVRPDDSHAQQYDEIEEVTDDDAKGEYQGVDTGSAGADMLVSNKQRLFKRKMSMMQSCRDVDRYEKLNRISEGTYGVVYRGRDLETSTVCALKRLKLENEKAGFPLTSVREINVLLALEHPNIVNVSEVVMGQRHAGDPRDDQIFMVMEYADHDLGSLKYRFSGAEIKCLMKQLLSGVAYLHDNYVMHRDLKPANILYNNKGQLKICDFGLARQFSSFQRDYTQMVVTLWYRAPELLLGTRRYSSAIDVWSVGCIMAQLLTGRALLNGKGEIDQLRKTYDVLGNPATDGYLATLPLWSKCSHIKRSAHAIPLEEVLVRANVSVTDELLDLLNRLLDLNPETRITAQDALDHPWFRCHPLPKDVALMPTFPSTNAK